jgi:PAS domain S-box-containing protein
MSVVDHLAPILEDANIGVFHLHVPTGKVLLNQALLRLSNTTLEQWERERWAWSEQVHPADRAEAIDKAQRMLVGQLDSYSIEYRVRTNGGDEWLSVRAQAAVTERDGSGRPVWLSGLLIDNSRERAAERRLRTATEAANVGLWEWDVATDAMWFSDQSCRLLQLEPGSGPTDTKSWRALVHPGDVSRIAAEILRYLRHEAAEYRIEFRMRCNDDSWTWFLSTARATDRDLDGRVSRIAGVLMNINAQHVVAERLALATEGANIGHWDSNELTGEMWVSVQWGAMLGYGADELPSTINAVFSLLHPDDHLRVMQSLGDFHSAQQAGSFEAEYRMRAKDGTWRWIHAKGRSVETSLDGRSTRQTGVTMDVTERKASEARLATAERLESLGRLAAGVAHEINTPIQYVSDNIYFVREGLQELSRSGRSPTARAADAELAYWQEHLPAAVERAIDGLGRVAEIVRSMSVLTHADQTEMRPVDLTRAIESTLVVAKNEYKLVADIHTDLAELPAIICHGGQINQVILNLIVNAAHAIADRIGDSEQRGLITVRTYQNDGEAVISIGDTGTGIPEAIRDRIFEPFFSTKEVGRGTGQGLSIVRNVVHSHGGSITFQTQANTGTTFFVRLPLHRAGHETAIEAA